jgi:hypothetical protein
MKQKHLNRLMDRMMLHEEKIQDLICELEVKEQKIKSLISSRIVINQTLMETLERVNHLEALYELNH